MEGDKLLTVEEASVAFGVKEATVRTWIWQGKLKPVKVGGYAVRIPSSEIRRINKEKQKVDKYVPGGDY
jgi:excisionase family DNA binding protein